MSYTFLKRITDLLRNKKDDFSYEEHSNDDTISYYCNSLTYNDIKTDLKQRNAKISLKPITPLGKNKFDNVTIGEIANSFGKKKLSFKVKLGERTINVYIFKNIYGGYKTTVSAHFHNKKLFNLRYEFDLRSESDCADILDLISLKYLNGSAIDVNEEYLIDENNTVLSFSNGSNLILDYHNNSEIFSYVNYLVDLDKVKKNDEVYERYKKLYTKL